MRDTFIRRLSKLVEHDNRIILITGDLGFGPITEFAKKHPLNFINAGVAEQNMAGIATGLALESKTVFIYSIANFPTLRCLEQIRNDICYHEANVKIIAAGGGFSYGALGMSHHATEDLAILRTMPMLVLAPGDLWEVAQIAEILVNTTGPCYLRLDKSYANNTQQNSEVFTIGKARLLKHGNDLTLATTGGILKDVLAVHNTLLTQYNINARVLHFHTIKPFDEEAISKAALETQGIISIEEHNVIGGLGGVIAESCLELGVPPKKFYRIGLRGGFAEIVGNQEYLKHAYGMSQENIVDLSLKMLKNHS